MADIAILVAEEHERRVKNSRKAGAGGGDMEINWVSCISSMADKMINNKMISQRNLGLLKLVSEPRTQFSLAVFNGFFCA